RSVVVMRAQELQVHDQEVHLRVPHPLPHPERSAVHPVHAGLDRRETVDQPQAAVAVSVPINLYTVLLDDFPLDEFNQSFHSSWPGLPDRMGWAAAFRC